MPFYLQISIFQVSDTATNKVAVTFTFMWWNSMDSFHIGFKFVKLYQYKVVVTFTIPLPNFAGEIKSFT